MINFSQLLKTKSLIERENAALPDSTEITDNIQIKLIL